VTHSQLTTREQQLEYVSPGKQKKAVPFGSAAMAGGDYGAVERMGQADGLPAMQATRPALPKFIAPMLVLILAGCACVLVSALYKADNQMSQVRMRASKLQCAPQWGGGRHAVPVVRGHPHCSGLLPAVCRSPGPCFLLDVTDAQDLYAFEQDDMYNKHIVWNGNQWVDENSGKPVSMRSQHLQTLLARQALTEALAEPAATAPNYNCCYVPKVTGHNGGVSLLDSTQLVESGMFCHMMIKNKPSSDWPMIRMGSLREAGVTTGMCGDWRSVRHRIVSWCLLALARGTLNKGIHSGCEG